MTGVLKIMDIRKYRDAGLDKTAVAQEVGLHRNTVSKYWDGVGQTEQSRSIRPSILDPYKEYIMKRLTKYPQLKAERLFQEIVEQGYPGSNRTVRRYIAGIRPEPSSREFKPFETLPGEQAQIDWGHLGKATLDGKRQNLYVFVFTLAWARVGYAEFITSLNMATFAGCLHRALEYVDGAPQTILFDNAKTVVSERVGSVVRFNEHLLQMASTYGFKPEACWAHDPETKGKVESNVKYVKNSFYYGTEFSGLEDLNQKLHKWLNNVANKRIHGTTQARPWDRLEEERPFLKELPALQGPVAIYETRKVTKTALISVGGNQYSVPSRLARKTVTCRRFEDRVEILYDNKVAAHHHLVPGKGQRVIKDEHYPAHQERSKGRRSALQRQFEELAPEASRYLQGLGRSRTGHLREQMEKIIQLSDDFSPEQLHEAMTRALEFNSFGYGSLKNILNKLSSCPQSLPQAPKRDRQQLNGDFSVEVERRDIGYYGRASS